MKFFFKKTYRKYLRTNTRTCSTTINFRVCFNQIYSSAMKTIRDR